VNSTPKWDFTVFLSILCYVAYVYFVSCSNFNFLSQTPLQTYYTQSLQLHYKILHQIKPQRFLSHSLVVENPSNCAVKWSRSCPCSCHKHIRWQKRYSSAHF